MLRDRTQEKTDKTQLIVTEGTILEGSNVLHSIGHIDF